MYHLHRQNPSQRVYAEPGKNHDCCYYIKQNLAILFHLKLSPLIIILNMLLKIKALSGIGSH